MLGCYNLNNENIQNNHRVVMYDQGNIRRYDFISSNNKGICQTSYC